MSELSTVSEDRIVRAKDIGDVTGLSEDTVRRLELVGQFPARLRLSPGTTGYRLSEVMEWMKSRRQVILSNKS